MRSQLCVFVCVMCMCVSEKMKHFEEKFKNNQVRKNNLYSD